ncbi:uncharacterized protein LOC123525524 [Mercenaria mercenaria]|uniref:uncharacterized protein LOC123525524 n=1 Tax=Mercenaria mercenaria TaxID=6596 RepID=UPI00234F00BE|nr:uncharacterized protein LOC123525524 [Mercenaria mercenaria]XP_045160570.2 uncharacterized protein LOC123525524 [Mercenaria mercenaria]
MTDDIPPKKKKRYSEDFNINTSDEYPSITDHVQLSSASLNLDRENFSIEQQQLAVALVLSGAKVETVSKDINIPPPIIISWLNENNTPSADGNEDINETVSTSSSTHPYFVDDTRNDEKEKQTDIDMCNEVQKKTEPERKKYSIEQQQIAIARVWTGAKIATVSKDMDIPPSTISTWLKKATLPSADGNEDIHETVSTSSSTHPYFVDDTRNDEKEKQIYIDLCNEVQKKTEPEREKYSIEQQQIAIARVWTGAKIATVSKDMGIPPSTITTWVKKAKLHAADGNENRPETFITAKHSYPIVLDENNGMTEFKALVENPDGNLCALKDSRTESTATAPLNKEKKKEEYMLTESMTHTNVLEFKYPEGSKSTNEMAKKHVNTKKDVSANGCNKKRTEQQKYKEMEQIIVNCSPREEKRYVTPIPSPPNNSIWIAKAGEKLRELYKSQDMRPNKQLCNETENDSKQSNKNATSNERCDVFLSPCSSNKLECSTSTAVLVETTEKSERQKVDVFPSGEIKRNKEEKKASDENSGLCSVTDSIKTGNTSLAKGVKRFGYTPEVKKKALERVKGGEKIASVGKDLDIPGSTIWDWTRKEKMTRENAQLDDCVPSVKWKKWQEIMSAENYGKGWTERDIGYRLEKLSQYFEDKYGLFELAVCKPTEKSLKVENIVYVKDGKILTLLERHCRYGFQKSILINNKLREGYSIKARYYCVASKEEAVKEKMKLLQHHDYAWNKQCRDDVADYRLPGDWGRWIQVMSPIADCAAENEWVKRDCGYKCTNLETWMKDEFGVFEMAIVNLNTRDTSVVLMEYGKILTAIGMYCSDSSSAKSAQINDVLNKGYRVLVRCCYAKSGAEKEAQVAESILLERYVYNWHKQRTKRENIRDEQFMGSWTEWKLIMVPGQTDGFIRRNGSNVGFRHNNIEALFQDQFGVFELQIARGDSKEVTYVQHGEILTLLQRYCSDGYKRSGMINRALAEGYNISVRYQYVNADNSKEVATALLRQLLSIYDYAWNKTRREDVDDEDIAGNWSDWVTMMTPQIQQGWTQRNIEDSCRVYHPNNFAKLFEEKYGIFEIKLRYHPHSATFDAGGEKFRDKQDTVVYIGKGNILTEVKTRCCIKTKQSMLIDQALKEGKCISFRYCYTENDTPEEAAELQRQLLERYDYTWIRSKREDVYDNNLPGEWSKWSKIMKPGEVEQDWEWRDEKFIGFKVKNLDGIFRDDYGVFELAVEKPDRDTIVHVGKGKVLSELKKYCKINTDGSYNSVQISDALAKRCSILVRYRDVQSKQDAEDVEQYLVDRYEYPWNPLFRTKREEVDDSSLPGQNWSEWDQLMTPHSNTPGWIRRDPGNTGYRLTDEKLKDIVIDERGVYELKIEKHGRIIVVYAGKAENVLQRLIDYCKNGSHKPQRFDDALLGGYNICVRFRHTNNIDDAEKKLLDRYNYAWNKSRNDKERDIFLPYYFEHN